MTAPPIRPARSAYLISNAQVTGGASPRRSVRRRRSALIAQIGSLVREDQARLVKPLHAVRPLSGNCTNPILFTEVGGTHMRPHLDTYVRCRKCEACLKQRGLQWAARARVEIARHGRTWMVTLTLAPAIHFKHGLLVDRAVAAKGSDPAALTEAEAFALRASEFGKETTKWLKRVRAAGARITYLQVVEAHKSGLPHVHLLVHDHDSNVTYRQLCDTWRLGFANAKLVEGRGAARYVTKYLMKSALARVRASLRYGL